ncbi:synaptonemal complex protein 2 isoform 3-T3 [Hipposideros larvatus]
MVGWYETSKEIVLSQGNSKDEAVLHMIEDLFDLLMVIYYINDEGKRQVVESFAPRICALVIDSRVNISIQQETLKKMNAMLDKLPQDDKKIFSNQEMLIFMSGMGERMLNAGDYDLQVGIVEALCRMTTENERQELACQWFSMDFIANAFKGIKDSQFETDCRTFLNFVNGMLGDKRRVFTFPCLSVFLDEYELQTPADEKLEEFWIDFNLGSQSLSFYIAGDNDDHQWETVTVPEDKVLIYSIGVIESKKLLTIILKNTVKISNSEGRELHLYFHASLEITKVTQKIFGADKYKELNKKQSISVAKTSVHVLYDASGLQILVPETQTSPVEEELVSLKEKLNSQKEFAKPPEYIKNRTQRDKKNSQLEKITPSKRKMSEASMIVPGAERYTVRSPVLLISTSTARRGRIKPPLQMIGSAEKAGVSETLDSAVSLKSRPSEVRPRGDDTDKHIKTANAVEKTDNKDTDFPNQNFNELQNIVPDSQSVGKINKAVFPGDLDNICGNKMHSKRACWTSVTNINLCENQRTSTSPGDTCHQDIVVNKNLTKQKSSSSISDDNSEETGKVEYEKERMQHKVDTAEGEVCRRNSQQLHHPHSDQENTENTKQSNGGFESETTIKPVLNKRVEESVIYRKKYILSKNVTTAICDENSSRRSTKSHTKSRKRLKSELHSWDLKPKKMKEKSKENGFTNAAESLINQINKRYKPLDDRSKSARKLKKSLIDSGFSNKSDLQLSKEKARKKSYRQLKTTFVNVTSQFQLDDVYNFNLNGADEPIIKLGTQDFEATAREACVDNSKSVGLRSHNEPEPSLKTEDKRILTDHKKKKPLSDTDIEYSYDDSKTDVSWLREPKSKPPLVDYSRNKTVKKQKRGKSRPSLERGQPTSKMTPSKNITKKVDETVPGGRTRLPRRAADTKKNYKDLSNSESESEKDASHSLEERLLVKEENICSRSKTTKRSKKEQDAVSTETRKAVSEEWNNASLLKDTTRDNNRGLPPMPVSGGPAPPMPVSGGPSPPAPASGGPSPPTPASGGPSPPMPASGVPSPPTPVSGSPPSMEVMRGNIGMEEMTESDITQDYECTTKSTSLYLQTASPKSLNSKYGGGGSIKSPKQSEKNVLCARESCSPVLQSSFLECHSASPLSTSSEREEKMWYDVPHDTAHGSGPTPYVSRKRMYIEDNGINSYQVGLEEEELRANLLANKLSKMEAAAHPTDKGSESISSLSTKAFSISGENWKSEISGVHLCEQSSTELGRKSDVRQKLLDYFTKQSWKTAQYHLQTMSHKIQEFRIRKHDKFQVCIIQELENFEKDSQSLKDLEKEFVDFGEKLFQKFSAYQKSELERLHLLKASLDKNVFYSPDHEETIYTSEMSFMKENMKKLQARLLKEMQEEELLSVRKGLLSIFMAHEPC